jgi:hypothetical protein
MRAIGLISIAVAAIVLTATDVRGASNRWCASYTRPANEKLYLCDVRAVPSPGVGTWRMVSAQSVP